VTNDRRADGQPPRPPSERATEPEAPAGVGVFRLAGWGWGFTIALALLVGGVVLLGYLREDPGRNPAPAAYRTAVCSAFDELSAATRALERGVEANASGGLNVGANIAAEVERHVAAADEALTDLPEWGPGRSLDELIGSQIITLTNGAAAQAEGDASQDLEAALEVDAIGREQLNDGRYGFDCSG
jgi:hypothetical protein